MVEAVFVGAPASTQPGLTQYLLNSDEILEEHMLRLQGKVKVTQPDGTTLTKKVGKEYSEQVQNWMRGKLLEVLNKHMYLSNLDKKEMLKEARIMMLIFWKELWFRSCEFDLELNDLRELLTLYCNTVMPAVHAPLDAGMRKAMTETHSETTSRVMSEMKESSEKKGLFNLFGR